MSDNKDSVNRDAPDSVDGGQSRRVLWVEPSATLRHAVQRQLVARGWRVLATSDYSAALTRLLGERGAAAFDAVMVGLPVHKSEKLGRLLEALRSSRLRELVVMILAHTAEPEVFEWVGHRGRSALLLWDDYTDCAECLARMVQPTASKDEPRVQSGDEIRVLLVDDSRAVRAGYARLLRERDYVVETASNVAEAIETARRSTFDIAIVDYFMPGGNGDVLCRRLREDPRTAGITTAILTGTYSDEVIRDTLEAGAVECMFKNEANELFLARLAAMSRAIRSKKSIDAERRRLESILSSVGDGVYGVNTDGQITFINPAARHILGCRADDSLIGRSAHKLFHYANEEGAQIEVGACVLQQAYRAGSALQAWGTVFWHRSGKPVPVECTVYPLRIEDRLEGSVVAFRDVSERRHLERELLWQATHDPLTKLHNRSHFERQLEEEVNRLKRSHEHSALLYLDLDRFKYINDTAGHAAGDQLLIEIGTRLHSRLRDSDLLARLGGDEFAIILRNIDVDNVLAAADSFREVLEEYSFVCGEKTYNVYGSIGVALIGREAQSPGEVLANADIACHIAKGRGRNQTHLYVAESDEKVAMHLELGWSARLQEALKADTFELHYQPILPLKPLRDASLPEQSGALYDEMLTKPEAFTPHYEVLVRFVDGRGELILPNAFLPTAERFGLMPQIDNWVVATAVRKLAALHASGWPITFTINISGQTVDADHLIPLVKALCQEHGLPASALIFEITETSAIANIEAAKRLIHELRSLGCRFALDDFGSGFSSFYHLKHLPVDFIKIDGQFVQGMLNNPIDRSIVSSINEIAHSFGKQTIAEFVENAAILKLLRVLDVDFVQGHYISSPQAQLRGQGARTAPELNMAR